MSKQYMITVPAASLLKVIRRIDLNVNMHHTEFAAAFDDLRAAFTGEEIALGQLINHGGKYEPKPLDELMAEEEAKL